MYPNTQGNNFDQQELPVLIYLTLYEGRENTIKHLVAQVQSHNQNNNIVRSLKVSTVSEGLSDRAVFG